MAWTFGNWAACAVIALGVVVGCDGDHSHDHDHAPATQADPVEAGEFVRLVGMNCRLALQSSELVLEKNIADDERAFAENVREHGPRLLQSLQQVAQPKEIAVPSELDDEHRARLDPLRALEGDALAGAYHDLQAEIHRDLVHLLTNASHNLQDPDLQAWAGQHLPQAQSHLKELSAHDHDHSHAH